MIIFLEITVLHPHVLSQNTFFLGLRPSNTGNIFSATYHATMLRCKLRRFAKSKTDAYFLQHKNLLFKKVVIRTTNHLNLLCNIVARQLAQKMLPVLLGLYARVT